MLLDIITGKRTSRTPYYSQSEASECALACLAMVAAFHGYETDLAVLRRRYATSLRGVTLPQLMGVAEALGLITRPLRCEVDELGQLGLPAILHWGLNHFVVLTRISSHRATKRFHINDPARGVLIIGEQEFSRSFTGVAVEVLKAQSFRPKIDVARLRIRQMWTSISGFWTMIGQVTALAVILQLAALVTPFYLQISVDTVVQSVDRDLLAVLAVGFGGVALVSFLTGWLRALILVTLNNALSYQIIVNLFRHLMRLPLPWFERRHVGDIISRFGSTKPITDLLSQGMIAALIDGLMAIMTLILMLVYSPVLGCVAVTVLAAYWGIRAGFLRTIQLTNVSAIAAAAHENSVFIETVRGVSAIKAFGKEGPRQRLWQKAKADAVIAQVRLGRLSAGFDASNQFLMAIENVLFIWLAITMVLDAKLTIGMVFAFQSYKQQFLGAGVRLIDQAVNWNILKMHLSRIADIALSAPEAADLYGSIPMLAGVERSSPRVELRNVHFAYGSGEAPVLKGVNLTIEPGETITLIGPSGGGKTTLLKIIQGLFTPTYGDVLIDGVPLHHYGIQRWRSQCGSVAQDDILFAGSMAENIAFFDSPFDLNRVREVARIAHIDHDIQSFPMQYDTLSGDMGSVLSGGQRQRLLLARALYSRPSMLFLDEGTAHLDPLTETAVLNSLRSETMTKVMVTHRQFDASSSRILLVREGRVSDFTQIAANAV